MNAAGLGFVIAIAVGLAVSIGRDVWRNRLSRTHSRSAGNKRP